jgi:hypothetical protein
VTDGFEVPTLAENARMGHPQLFWFRTKKTKGARPFFFGESEDEFHQNRVPPIQPNRWRTSVHCHWGQDLRRRWRNVIPTIDLRDPIE